MDKAAPNSILGSRPPVDAIIAFDGEDPIALYRFVVVTQSRAAYDDGIAVAGPYRRKGIGTSLREHLMAYLREMNISQFHIMVDKTPEAQAFHRKLIGKKGVLPEFSDKPDRLILTLQIDLQSYIPSRAEVRMNAETLYFRVKHTFGELIPNAAVSANEYRVGQGEVWISLQKITEARAFKGKSAVELRVADNGRGFDIEDVVGVARVLREHFRNFRAKKDQELLGGNWIEATRRLADKRKKEVNPEDLNVFFTQMPATVFVSTKSPQGKIAGELYQKVGRLYVGWALDRDFGRGFLLTRFHTEKLGGVYSVRNQPVRGVVGFESIILIPLESVEDFDLEGLKRFLGEEITAYQTLFPTVLFHLGFNDTPRAEVRNEGGNQWSVVSNKSALGVAGTTSPADKPIGNPKTGGYGDHDNSRKEQINGWGHLFPFSVRFKKQRDYNQGQQNTQGHSSKKRTSFSKEIASEATTEDHSGKMAEHFRQSPSSIITKNAFHRWGKPNKKISKSQDKFSIKENTARPEGWEAAKRFLLSHAEGFGIKLSPKKKREVASALVEIFRTGQVKRFEREFLAYFDEEVARVQKQGGLRGIREDIFRFLLVPSPESVRATVDDILRKVGVPSNEKERARLAQRILRILAELNIAANQLVITRAAEAGLRELAEGNPQLVEKAIANVFRRIERRMERIVTGPPLTKKPSQRTRVIARLEVGKGIFPRLSKYLGNDPSEIFVTYVRGSETEGKRREAEVEIGDLRSKYPDQIFKFNGYSTEGTERSEIIRLYNGAAQSPVAVITDQIIAEALKEVVRPREVPIRHLNKMIDDLVALITVKLASLAGPPEIAAAKLRAELRDLSIDFFVGEKGALVAMPDLARLTTLIRSEIRAMQARLAAA